MENEFGELSCSVTIEKHNCFGQVVQKKAFKGASIVLGRDELRDIMLKIVGKSGIEHKYLLENVKIFGRFVKQGKATIAVKDNISIFISNCPPDKLNIFLKGASAKLASTKGFSSDKDRLYNFKQRTFNHISPLTQVDINRYRNQCQKSTLVIDRGGNSSVITGETPKRKRIEVSKPRKRLNQDNEKAELVGSEYPGRDEVDKQLCFTAEQKKILEAVKTGQSIFFTGSAGTGKSVLLRRIIGMLPPDATVASASTGVAACQIGGVTLHSFAGIGSGSASIERCIELVKRPQISQQWKRCQHLIIDEVSMIDGDFFDKIEEVARVVRKSTQPFGGIQLILCGDFLQLPPVSKGKDKTQFCFQAQSWDSCIHQVYELTTVQRQKDPVFINILQYIRVGKCPEKVLHKLRQTQEKRLDKNGITATRLCTHKNHVKEINSYQMNELSGERRMFYAFDDDAYYSKQMDNMLPVNGSLELKIGAQVMLTKNIDVSHRLVNGARGVVVDFKADSTGFPVVVFHEGMKKVVKPEKFILKISAQKNVTRVQIPLQLAWAISIHKSQGLTLDSVEVSLSRVFEYGQAYVALSRARSLDGLRVLDIDEHSVKAHPEVLQFYINLRRRFRLDTN